MMLILPFMAFVKSSSNPLVGEVSRAFTTARMAAELSQKSCAIDMELDEAHLSKQVNVDGINLNRIALIRSQVFRRVFLTLLADIFDCADLLVNPIAGDAAREIAREMKALHAELAAVRRELVASQREKVTA